MPEAIELSVVIPVYGNEDSLPLLVEELGEVLRDTPGSEVVFVIDGSPDGSRDLLQRLLPSAPFASILVVHSRNFGSFPAIRTGLSHARGERVSVIAADRQEPTDLVLDFARALQPGIHDVAIGVRRTRADESRSSRIFWGLYRRFVQPDIPVGGVDIFGCTAAVRDQLLSLPETNTSLIGLLFWVGHGRIEVPYDRRARLHGTSGWTFRKKLRYLADSVFAFTDLPIRFVFALGAIGVLTSIGLSVLVGTFRIAGYIEVPGYAALMLVTSFFAGLNLCAIGVIGSYLWRTFENTKERPSALVMDRVEFSGRRATRDSSSA